MPSASVTDPSPATDADLGAVDVDPPRQGGQRAADAQAAAERIEHSVLPGAATKGIRAPISRRSSQDNAAPACSIAAAVSSRGPAAMKPSAPNSRTCRKSSWRRTARTYCAAVVSHWPNSSCVLCCASPAVRREQRSDACRRRRCILGDIRAAFCFASTHEQASGGSGVVEARMAATDAGLAQGSGALPDSQHGEATGRLLDRWAGAWLGVVSLLAVAVYGLVKSSMIDDSYITLAYARNLALHFHWGLIPHEVANSATSPLNVLLLAAVMAVLRLAGDVNAELAVGVLFVTCMLAVGWAWLRISRALRLPSWVAVFGTLLVLVNPFVLSATGLEVHLIAATLLLLVARALEGRPVWFGVVGGLALLVRPDLIIFVVCIALGSAPIRRQLGRAAFTTIAVGAPWYLFSWFFFGSAIADTLVVKMAEHTFLGYAAGSGVVNWTYFEGPQFYLRSLDLHHSVFRGAVVTFAPAAAGLLALLVWSGLRLGRRGGVERLDPVASAAIGGLVYYGAYSLLGVPPYQWYYVAPILALSIFLLVALGALADALGRRGG